MLLVTFDLSPYFFFTATVKHWHKSHKGLALKYNIECGSAVHLMSTRDVTALKESTQQRLFQSPSIGWFSCSEILTAVISLWVPLFGPLKQIKGRFLLSSLTVTVWMLLQSWYFFGFKLPLFLPSISWSVGSVLSCMPCVKTNVASIASATVTWQPLNQSGIVTALTCNRLFFFLCSWYLRKSSTVKRSLYASAN